MSFSVSITVPYPFFGLSFLETLDLWLCSWPEFSVERTEKQWLKSDSSVHGSILLSTFAKLPRILITCRTEPPVLDMVLSTCYSPLSLLPSLILCQSLSSIQQPRLGQANAPGMVVLTPSSSPHVTNGSLIMGIFSSLPRILLLKGYCVWLVISARDTTV